MIGKLVGRVEEKATHSVLINVAGVCYEVEVPISTAFVIPELGAEVSLYCHFVVREDAQLLYGFVNKKERDMFRVLIKVNGVGPKLALTILSGLDSAALARCVVEDDVSTLVKLPGIGKKTAERLLIELRDKVKDIDVAVLPGDLLGGEALSLSTPSLEAEAEAALVALGYKPQEASKAIKAVTHEGQTLESLIKASLKGML